MAIPSPYAHFKCNDNAANTVAIDDGSGSNNGTANVNTSVLSSTGKINEAFDFNGSTEHINITTFFNNIASDTTGSIAFWVRSSIDTDAADIFTFGDQNALGLIVVNRGQADNIFRFVLVDGADLIRWHSTTNSFPINTWVHFVVVQDGVKPKFYINGTEDTTPFVTELDTTLWLNSIPGLDNAYICARDWYNRGLGWHNRLAGKVDDFRYYQNYVLTADDVAAIWNNGNGTEADQPIPSFIITRNQAIIIH